MEATLGFFHEMFLCWLDCPATQNHIHNGSTNFESNRHDKEDDGFVSIVLFMVVLLTRAESLTLAHSGGITLCACLLLRARLGILI